MIFDYEFATITPIIIAVLFGLIILVEIIKPNRKRMLHRVVATLLMFLGVLGVFVQPRYLTPSNKKVILLTDGFDQNVVDSIKKEYKNIDVAQLDELSLDEIREIYIIGEGLETYDFDQLKTMKVVFIPTSMSNGINKVHYNISQTQDKAFSIKGECRCPPESKVIIEGPEGRIDSLDSPRHFEFQVKPKVVGRQRYYLEYWEDTLLVERNPIPVSVKAPEKLSVLILNSFPTFESNHIKLFLSSKNHAITIRNRVSENRFSNEFINTGRTEISTITPKMLDQMDLLVIDQKEWLTLTNNDRKLLENEVNEGLGILLFGIDNNAFSKSVFTDFEVKERSSNDVAEFIYKSIRLKPIALSFNKSEKLFPFPAINSEQVSAYQIKGKGKVGVVLISDTYRMKLNGETEAYSSFWSNHIELLSNSNKSFFEMTVHPKMIWNNNPVTIRMITSENEITSLKVDSVGVSLKQSVLQNEVWSGKYWSDKSGWHKISNNEEIEHFYVFDYNDWKTLHATQKIKENKRQFTKQIIDGEQRYTKRQISLVYAFLLFIIGAGYLWLEAKL